MTEQTPTLHAVSVKLPPFWPEDPALWFRQVEAQFATRGINQSLTKYNYIVASLSPDTAREVRDLILQPPADDPYTALKEQLTLRTALTPSQRMQKLLHLEPLGDLKPSQLLRRIEQLAEKSLDNDLVLQEIFMTRLPAHVQLILKAQPSLTIQQRAHLADTLLTVQPVSAPQPLFSIDSASSEGTAAVPQDTIASLRGEINELKRQLRLPRRPGKQPPSVSAPLCWYHARFGSAATKCSPPCAKSGNATLDH